MRRGMVRLLAAACLSAGCFACAMHAPASSTADSMNPIVTAPTLSVAPNTPQQQTGPTPGITKSPPDSQSSTLGAR